MADKVIVVLLLQSIQEGEELEEDMVVEEEVVADTDPMKHNSHPRRHQQLQHCLPQCLRRPACRMSHPLL